MRDKPITGRNHKDQRDDEHYRHDEEINDVRIVSECTESTPRFTKNSGKHSEDYERQHCMDHMPNHLKSPPLSFCIRDSCVSLLFVLISLRKLDVVTRSEVQTKT
ncbi:MAG: hypothetical protein AAB975_04600, partial [Patescibacteria group bacterium]